MNNPQIYDAVLGGNGSPAPGVMVLGTGKKFGQLFDKFNAEAKVCNKYYLRLELTPLVALVRKRRASPLDDIRIKVWWRTDSTVDALTIYSYWAFAGYLRHDGLLFSHTAKYDPARCDTELRAVALKALREAK